MKQVIYEATEYAKTEVEINAIRSKVHGKTFFNFELWYSIIPGGYHITVCADFEDDRKVEALEMLIHIM
jgi:hypothetical protein